MKLQKITAIFPNVYQWTKIDSNVTMTFSETLNIILPLYKKLPTVHLMIVQFVILLLRSFIYVKIPKLYVNKSASRLYVYAPKVE